MAARSTARKNERRRDRGGQVESEGELEGMSVVLGLEEKESDGGARVSKRERAGVSGRRKRRRGVVGWWPAMTAAEI